MVRKTQAGRTVMVAGQPYPFWSLTIIAMDVIALYGLCAYGSRENVQAAV